MSSRWPATLRAFPLAGLVALAAACTDAVAPDPDAGRSAGLVAPRGPSFGLVSNGAFTETFNFPEARVTTASAGGFGIFGDCGGGWSCVAPKPWRPTDFDVAIHLRDRDAWDAPESFRAMHGLMCQPYSDALDISQTDDGVSHLVGSYEDMNYRCRNHMMTAIRASGYGAMYVTPNAMVDFSAGEATVRWAMSTFRTSQGDWVDLWITPWTDNLALPLDGALSGVDLQGPPKRAIHVRMTSTARDRTAFEAYAVTGHVETKLASADVYYEDVLPNKQTSTRRDTFQLRISRTGVKFGMWKGDADPSHAGALPLQQIDWVDATLPAPLDWTTGVVQFGHHSLGQTAAGVGGTWHWDDFTLSRAVPFQIIRAANAAPVSSANARYADSKHPDMTLAATTPAAGEGYLRFAAFGERVQVSFDGAKWVDAARQAEKLDLDGRFHSYWMPIPAGVATVSFKAKKDKAATESTNKDGGEWRVRDVSVWVR